jgi:hypothetical protein
MPTSGATATSPRRADSKIRAALLRLPFAFAIYGL